MNENFDRAPGAGRTRNPPSDQGPAGTAGDGDTKATLFNQREPLRQPRTFPPFADSNAAAANDNMGGGGTELTPVAAFAFGSPAPRRWLTRSLKAKCVKCEVRHKMSPLPPFLSSFLLLPPPVRGVWG